MFDQITTIHVAKQDIHLATAIMLDFLVNTPLPGVSGVPFIAGYEVLDDRGGSEHFLFRVEDWTVAQAKKVFKDRNRFYIAGTDK